MKQKIILLILLFSSTLSWGQNSKNFTIAILADHSIDNNNEKFYQLKNEIKSVIGESANVVFDESFMLKNNLNKQLALQNYLKMAQEDQVDLILSFGALSNYVIAQNKDFKKPVILFGVINNDFITLPEGQSTSGKKNITYVLTPQSFEKDLTQFRETYPFKKIGIIIDEYVTKIHPVKKTLDKTFQNIDSEYELIPINTVDDIKNQLTNVDAVYIAGGNFLPESDKKKMVEYINEKKLPSFSSLDESYKNYGVLLASEPENHTTQFIRRIALNIESAINGENLSDLPIYIEFNSKLCFNIETAFKINFPIKYSFLIKTKIIGDAKKLPYLKRYTYKDVIEQALEQNLNLKASEKNINLAKQDVKLAKSEYLPDLTASATGSHLDPELAKVSNGSNPEYKTSGAITVKQTIFSEQASANIKIKKELEKAAHEDFSAKELDIILNAGKAYYNALIAKANYLINDENLRVTRQNHDIAKQKYSAGQTSKSDVLRWKSQLAVATQNSVSAYTHLSQAFINLNQVLNNPIDYTIDVIDDKSENKQKSDKHLFNVLDDQLMREKLTDFIIEQALDNAHELKSITHNIQAVKFTERMHKRSKYLPTVGIQGQYNHTFSRDGEGTSYPTGFMNVPDGYYNVALQLTFPIFYKNQRTINRKKAHFQLEQLGYQKDQTELNIKANVNNILLDILSQFANIKLSQISTEAAKESLDLMQTSYSEGAIGITTLIDAQNAHFQAKQQQVNVNYNLQTSIIELERVISYFFILHSTEENDAFIQKLSQRILSAN
jgi:outer membrane protein TolC